MIQIKHRFTDAVLYECACETIKDAVQKAAKEKANLYAASLRGADLRGADLGGANLGGANLGGANLRGADLRGAKINWQSHALLDEILKRGAGDDIQKCMVAGLIAMSMDWCWDKFLSIEIDHREWALKTLAAYIVDCDDHPNILDKYMVTA